MLEARRGAWWDANRIGMWPPPIETSSGWLMIYHEGPENTFELYLSVGSGSLRSSTAR